MLSARNFDRGAERLLRLRSIRRVLGQQQFAVEPMQFRLIISLAGSLDELECRVDGAKTLIVPPHPPHSGGDKGETTVVNKLGARRFQVRHVMPHSRDAAIEIAGKYISP